METLPCETENYMKTENFILPQTERTINAIIAELSRFFEVARLVATGYCAAYLALRAALFSLRPWLDALIMALYLAQFVLLVLEHAKGSRLKKCALALRTAKRVSVLAVFVLALRDVFAARQAVQFWQVAACIVTGLGWLVVLAGDAFSLTVPRYSHMIVSSFKKDIEVRSLVSRGMGEVKMAAKNALKNEQAKKTFAVGGIALSAGIIGVIAKKIFKSFKAV